MDPLQAMKYYNQWVVCNSQKVPIDQGTGRAINAQDPANWLPYNTAAELAHGLGFHVAFVFTAQDPFFFLDIDNCLQPDGQWSALAHDLCNRFSGCAVEISMSGKGLHIFGTVQKPIIHGCKNSTHGIELYTFGRFAIVTGTGARGDASKSAQGEIMALVTSYFSKTVETHDQEWTTEPDPEWSGPEDDDELISRMVSSKSARSIMGRAVSVKDLWEANADALGQHFPDVFGEQGRPYDASSADAAFCAHLAFWTGKNCERIDRIFRRSGLIRDKWLDREGYRKSTIKKAVAGCSAVYKQAKQEPLNNKDAPGVVIQSGINYMIPQEQIEYFKGMVYIRPLDMIFLPDGDIIGKSRFNNSFGGYTFSIDVMNKLTTRYAWDAFTMNQVVKFPKVNAYCFRPEIEPGKIIKENGLEMVNTYVPIETDAEPGDITPFTTHVSKLLPDPRDAEILISYLAACVQYPGVKFQWCPVIQGTPGNGKSFINSVMIYAIGRKYYHCPNAKDLANKFNAWLQGKLYVGIEEAKSTNRVNIAEDVKEMITNPLIEIQGKGVNQYIADNRANFAFFANHQDGIRKTLDDRRFCPLFTAQQSATDLTRDGMTEAYFKRLFAWLNGGGHKYTTYYLKTRPIVPEFNPATDCLRAPVTTSTQAALMAGLDEDEQEVLTAIEDEMPGFLGGWISSKAINRTIGARTMTAAKRKQIVANLGYEPHPALPDGRVNNAILQDGGRSYLYVIKGRRNTERNPAEVRAAFMAAQGYTS